MKNYASLFAACAASMAVFGIANAAEVPPAAEAANAPATSQATGEGPQILRDVSDAHERQTQKAGRRADDRQG